MCDWMWHGIRMEVVNILIVLSSTELPTLNWSYGWIVLSSTELLSIGHMGDWLIKGIMAKESSLKTW